MRRSLAILLGLWVTVATGAGLPDFFKGMRAEPRAEPRFQPLPQSQRRLPAAGFTAETDRVIDQGISPGEAARRAQQMNGGGRVLSVEPASGGWRVKLIKNGDVRIVFIPN